MLDAGVLGQPLTAIELRSQGGRPKKPLTQDEVSKPPICVAPGFNANGRHRKRSGTAFGDTAPPRQRNVKMTWAKPPPILTSLQRVVLLFLVVDELVRRGPALDGVGHAFQKVCD